jgi:hypothetical protein
VMRLEHERKPLREIRAYIEETYGRSGLPTPTRRPG